MRAAGKIALVFACIASIALCWFGWRAYQNKARNAKRGAALERYREQVAQGDPLAEALLARMYSDGDGVQQDYQQALSLYRKSADQGSRAGEAGLGSMYFYGRGVPVDYTTAFMWYSKAAAQGNPYAENAVGIMLHHGAGTVQDDSQALNWFRKAADRRYANAEYNLGRMYWYGYGIPPDRSEAYRWIRKAADDGDEDAQRFLSMPLSTFAAIRLSVLFAFGLYCLSGFVLTRRWQIVRAQERDSTAFIAIGVLWVVFAAYSWYGYTHHLMRRPGAGMNAFTAGRWLMDAVVVVTLIYILRSEKKPQHGEIDPESQAT